MRQPAANRPTLEKSHNTPSRSDGPPHPTLEKKAPTSMNQFPKNSGLPKVEPSVGRIVHVWNADGATVKPYPAMVVVVTDGCMTIDCAHVHVHDGMRIVRDLKHVDDTRHNNEAYWDWPEVKPVKFVGAQGGAITGSVHGELGKQQAGAPSPVDGKR